MENRLIDLDGRQALVRVFYEPRRDCRASIVRSGINIRLPEHISRKEAEKQIASFSQWAARQYLNPGNLLRTEKLVSYQTGDTLMVRETPFTIRIADTNNKGCTARIDEHYQVLVKVPRDYFEDVRNRAIGAAIARAIAHFFEPFITARVHELNHLHLKAKVGQVRLRNNRSRWGSCARNGNISIATRLLLAPEEIINAVILHELAHLRQPNHGPAFYALLAKIHPEYKACDVWLRKNGHRLQF